VKKRILYIGQDEQLAHHLSGILLHILSESLPVFNKPNDAIEWLIEDPGGNNPIILFEKQVTNEDLGHIKLLRRNFPYAYILLVTLDLTPAERLQYIRAGVNDTVSPTVKPEAFIHFFHFIQKYEPVLQGGTDPAEEAVDTFKVPAIKRAFDLFVSVFALLFLSPLMLLVALAIHLESKGPIFYKSKRVGSNYQIFDFWKFRSMYVDADKRLKEVGKFNQYATNITETEPQVSIDEALDPQSIDLSGQLILVDDDYIISEEEFVAQKRQKTDNAFVKIEKDPRVTRVGYFIRKYSIDELPQLINILKGDMSVVGNRPLPLYEAELLTKDSSVERFIAPSGLTGLWQVQKRGGAGKLSADERKQLDIYYAQHYSFWLDIKIIFRTFTAFIQKEDV